MDVATIKAQTSMFELLPKYGMTHRRGMVSCPLHTDKHPSMKIYKDGYHCFSCQVHGDVLDFVQMMEGVDFEEACRILGGGGGRFSAYRSRLRSKARQKKKQEEEKRLAEAKRLNFLAIDTYRDIIEKSEPFSDPWCEATNKLQMEYMKMWQLHNFEDGW